MKHHQSYSVSSHHWGDHSLLVTSIISEPIFLGGFFARVRHHQFRIIRHHKSSVNVSSFYFLFGNWSSSPSLLGLSLLKTKIINRPQCLSVSHTQDINCRLFTSVIILINPFNITLDSGRIGRGHLIIIIIIRSVSTIRYDLSLSLHQISSKPSSSTHHPFIF